MNPTSDTGMLPDETHRRAPVQVPADAMTSASSQLRYPLRFVPTRGHPEPQPWGSQHPRGQGRGQIQGRGQGRWNPSSVPETSRRQGLFSYVSSLDPLTGSPEQQKRTLSARGRPSSATNAAAVAGSGVSPRRTASGGSPRDRRERFVMAKEESHPQPQPTETATATAAAAATTTARALRRSRWCYRTLSQGLSGLTGCFSYVPTMSPGRDVETEALAADFYKLLRADHVPLGMPPPSAQVSTKRVYSEHSRTSPSKANPPYPPTAAPSADPASLRPEWNAHSTSASKMSPSHVGKTMAMTMATGSPRALAKTTDQPFASSQNPSQQLHQQQPKQIRRKEPRPTATISGSATASNVNANANANANATTATATTATTAVAAPRRESWKPVWSYCNRPPVVHLLSGFERPGLSEADAAKLLRRPQRSTSLGASTNTARVGDQARPLSRRLQQQQQQQPLESARAAGGRRERTEELSPSQPSPQQRPLQPTDPDEGYQADAGVDGVLFSRG